MEYGDARLGDTADRRKTFGSVPRAFVAGAAEAIHRLFLSIGSGCEVAPSAPDFHWR